MKRVVLLCLSALFLAAACSAGPEYPDENEIRHNADKSHKHLNKEEKKRK